MLRFARWATLAAAVAACSGQGAISEQTEPAVVELQGVLTRPRTLHRGHVYVIRSLFDLHAPVAIQPGAVVKFGPNGALWAHVGRIVAVGTEAEPVVFTSLEDDTYGGDTNGDGAATTPGSGGEPYLNAFWIQTQADGSVFEHCRILYGGSASNPAMSFSRATVLRDSVIAHSFGGVAVEVADLGGGSVIESNVFFGNRTPLALSAPATVAGNVFHDPSSPPPYGAETANWGNWPNQVDLVPTDPWAAPVTATFSGVTSLAITEVALVAKGDVLVPAGSTFTLMDGTVLKMRTGSRISVAAGDDLVLGQGSLVTAWTDEANGGHVLGMTGPPAAASWLGVWSEGAGAWISDPRFLYSANSSP